MLFNVRLLRFPDVINLNDAENRLERSQILDETVEDDLWPAHEPLTKRWNHIHPFNNQIHEITSGTREVVRFIYSEGYNEREKRKDKWQENGLLVEKFDRVNVTKVNTMFFQINNSVYAAPVMSPSTNLNTYCSDLFPGEIWGEIVKDPNDFWLSKDFYYWLLNSFTRNNGRITPTVRITSWTGFQGVTQDAIHKLAGEGDHISAILGTMAFLFMDDPFKSLSVVIQYENERVPVLLGSAGNLEIYEFEYEGRFANAYGGEQLKVLLTIMMYTKILPHLFDAYNTARATGLWNDQIKEQFRQWIGDAIISRVSDELQITI